MEGLSDPASAWKRQAAEAAAAEVASGMVVGLGHGSTAAFALARLAARLRTGELAGVLGVACSRLVAAEAVRLGIPLADTQALPAIDLTIDGADEVGPDLTLVKGGGGALTREKIVAQASRRRLYVVDEAKLSPAAGSRRPVPVEVLEFGLAAHVRFLEYLGAGVALRRGGDGRPVRTDQGHLLLDCRFGPVADPAGLAAALKTHAGVVEHGLFVALADVVIVAGPSGLRRLTPPGSRP